MQSETQLQQSKAKTNLCKLCFEQIEDTSIHSILFKDAKICHKCYLKFKPKMKKFMIGNILGYYIYDYDEQIQNVLYQFKGCFDYELFGVFFDYLRLYLRIKFFGYILVPAPSSKEADDERGFNHVVQMFNPLKLKIVQCIHKTSNVKQSDLSAEQRKNIKNHLVIDDVDFSKKKILIVDDVFTTGSTVKAMIDLVSSKNPKLIKVLVMSKTKDKERGGQ